MLKKKVLAAGLTFVLAAGLMVGCSKTEQPTQSENPPADQPAQVSDAKYEDGIYFAQEDGFGTTGYKYVATLEVKDGKIVKADWNGANVKGGPDKDTLSKTGKYPMVEQGGAQAPWHEQAEKAEAYLLELQDPTKIEYTDEEGHTDAISGASIHVKEFFDLAQEALADAK